MFFAVRSAVSDPLSLLPAVQSAVWSIDRNVPLANPRTMQDVLAHSVLRRSSRCCLLSIFAGLATLLAAIGLYGVISYSVAQRTKEIGIRMALGGQREDMLRMVLRQSGMLVLIGILHRRSGRARCNAFVRRDALRDRRDRFCYLSSWSSLLLGHSGISRQRHPSFSRHQSRSHGRTPL